MDWTQHQEIIQEIEIAKNLIKNDYNDEHEKKNDNNFIVKILDTIF